MGAGALSLPATVSAIGDVPGAIGPVLCMVVVMAAFSAYSFSTIAEVLRAVRCALCAARCALCAARCALCAVRCALCV